MADLTKIILIGAGIFAVLTIILLISNLNYSKKTYDIVDRKLVPILTLSNPGIIRLAGVNNGAGKAIKLKLYSADWCNACRMFAPTWEKLKQEVNGDALISFERVDCSDATRARDIITQLQLKDNKTITHFPTVTVSREGEMEEIFDGRAIDSLETWKSKIAKL